MTRSYHIDSCVFVLLEKKVSSVSHPARALKIPVRLRGRINVSSAAPCLWYTALLNEVAAKLATRLNTEPEVFAERRHAFDMSKGADADASKWFTSGVAWGADISLKPKEIIAIYGEQGVSTYAPKTK